MPILPLFLSRGRQPSPIGNLLITRVTASFLVDMFYGGKVISELGVESGVFFTGTKEALIIVNLKDALKMKRQIKCGS